MTADLVNLSGYRFSRLTGLTELRIELRSVCSLLRLKGTILLAHEGVNISVSGAQSSIELFKEFAQNKFGIEATAFKETPIPSESFTRMLVKIKKEIITVGDTELRPDEKTAKRLQPSELKQWLDEGRPIVLLDTRNRYEIEVGTFSKADDLGLDTSREFTEKVTPLVDQLKDQTVVTFCTGGIRCEKASALLLKLGLKDVFQLDGGILRYFEENGSAHFEGNCFVFDWRLAVDGELNPVERSPDPKAEFGRHRR